MRKEPLQLKRDRAVTQRFQYEYREIYVRVMTADKQLCFDFASDEFTNILLQTCSASLESLQQNKFLVDAKITGHGLKKMKLSTFQAEWLHTPGEVVKNSNRNILKISSNRFKMFKILVAA